MPFPAARDARSGHQARAAEVRRLMADRTAQGRQAEAVGASENRRLMQPRRVPLARAIASRMAIETSRMGEHLADFCEIRSRPRVRIADRRKALDAGEAVRRPCSKWLRRSDAAAETATATMKSRIRKSIFLFSCEGIARNPPGSSRAPPHDI